MSVNQNGQRDSARFAHNSKEELDAKLQLIRAACALEELYELIEDYAPTSYTEHRREKVESALRLAKNL